MRQRNLLTLIPIGLLMLIMASQIYYMARQFMLSLSPVMISTFRVNFDKCSADMGKMDYFLWSGLQKYGSGGDYSDVIVSKLPDHELRIAMQLQHPSAAVFEKQASLLRPLIHCGTWCQADMPAGEQVTAPGCELTEDLFQPQDWDVVKPTENRVDALAVIALLIEATGIYFLWRRPRVPAQ